MDAATPDENVRAIFEAAEAFQQDANRAYRGNT
jgi:hypothetical protein